MKNRKQRNNAKPKAADKRQQPNMKTPALDPAPEPLGPPLGGEALEIKVAEKMCEGFRTTAARASLRKACGGAEQSAIEAAIVSPRVKNIVEPVTQAYALEHSNAVIRLLITNARAALEAEKPTPAQILALKIVFETLVEKRMVHIESGMWQDPFSLLGLSDFEKSVVDDTLQLMRRLRAPTTSGSQGCDVPAISTPESIEHPATVGA